jgi:hypothetical protein
MADQTENDIVAAIGMSAGFVSVELSRNSEKEMLKGADRLSIAKDYKAWMESGSPLHPNSIDKYELLSARLKAVGEQLEKITGDLT